MNFYFLKRYPIPTIGLVLAMFVIGDVVRPYGEWIRAVLGCFAFVMYTLYILKIVMFREDMKEKLTDPIMAARLPVLAMATVFLSGYAAPLSTALGAALWYAGTVGHALFILWFSYRFVLRGFSLKNVYPSWFTVYVGIAAASVAAPLTGRTDIGQAVFWFAIAAFALLLPFICWRAWWIRHIPDAAKPSIVLFTMPAALLLAAYITSFEIRDPRIMSGLTLLSSILYLIGLGYYIIFTWKNPNFTPDHADFAYPIAISALSTRLSAGASKIVFETTSLLAGTETIFASLILADVLVHYLVMLFAIWKKGKARSNPSL